MEAVAVHMQQPLRLIKDSPRAGAQHPTAARHTHTGFTPMHLSSPVYSTLLYSCSCKVLGCHSLHQQADGMQAPDG